MSQLVIVHDGDVINVGPWTSEDPMPEGAVEMVADIRFAADGRIVLADDFDALTQDATNAVQNLLDSTAQVYGYDNIASAVTYADEPAVVKFQQEGQAFRAWRSLVWHHCYEQLDAVQAGEATIPSMEDFLSGLPEIEIGT